MFWDERARHDVIRVLKPFENDARPSEPQVTIPLWQLAYYKTIEKLFARGY